MHSRLAAVTAAHAAARTMCIAVKTNMADFSSLDQEVKVKKRNRGRICSAYGCCNYQNTNKEFSYHRFPANQEVCKRWILRLRRADLEKLDYSKLKTKVVCSKHFDPSCYTTS